MYINNHEVSILVWLIPYIIAAVMLTTTAVCALLFTEIVPINGRLCPIRFNKGNRIFVAFIEAFYFAFFKIGCSQMLMEICRFVCKNDQFFTTMLYCFSIIISIVLYWLIVYVVFDKVSKLRQKALKEFLRRRDKYAR